MRNWLTRKPPRNGPVASSHASILNLRYVVLDTELTSLDHRTNRLLSVGAVVMSGSSILLGEQFYRLVNPQVVVPAETVVIHKLRTEDVSAGEPLEPVLRELSQFVAGSVLVGYFLGIDLKVLQKEMQAFRLTLDCPVVDTARIHEWLLRHGPYREDLHVHLAATDLASAARFYRIETGGAHHALTDAFITAQIWQRMLPLLDSNGVQSLRKLLRIGAP